MTFTNIVLKMCQGMPPDISLTGKIKTCGGKGYQLFLGICHSHRPCSQQTRGDNVVLRLTL